MTVETTDGRTLASGDVNAKGGFEVPMSLAEIEDKFHIMAAALPDARRTAIWNMRARLLDPETKFADLLRHLHAPI